MMQRESIQANWTPIRLAMVIQSLNVRVKSIKGIDWRRSGSVAEVVVADEGIVEPQQ